MASHGTVALHRLRFIKAPRALPAAFAAITAATLARLLAPLLPVSTYLETLAVSGALWTVAFAIFAAVFMPILIRPRIGGKPALSLQTAAGRT